MQFLLVFPYEAVLFNMDSKIKQFYSNIKDSLCKYKIFDISIVMIM